MEADERRDDGDVPHHRREVGDEELAVAVEDAQRPGGQHEHARHREDDADEIEELLDHLRDKYQYDEKAIKKIEAVMNSAS